MGHRDDRVRSVFIVGDPLAVTPSGYFGLVTPAER